jgi:diguanylate cyclase (GGDEF)-like protein
MATILIVDDRRSNREYLVALLGAVGHRLLEASDGVTALKSARHQAPDLVMTDILMPNMDGFALARELRADRSLRSVPIIFFSAAYLEFETRELARACGVQQILVKPMEPEAVLQAVQMELARPHNVPSLPKPATFTKDHLTLLTNKLYQKIEELEATNAQLEHRTLRLTRANLRLQNLSLTDTLTRLYNRRGFLQFATKQLKLIQRLQRRTCILFVDVDDLKSINDHFGHEVGDKTLVHVAEILRTTFRGSDVIGRLGGDEFAILAIGTDDDSERRIRARLRSNLDNYNLGVSAGYRISLSVGAVWIESDDSRTIKSLLTDADQAMYIEKSTKKLHSVAK